MPPAALTVIVCACPGTAMIHVVHVIAALRDADAVGVVANAVHADVMAMATRAVSAEGVRVVAAGTGPAIRRGSVVVALPVDAVAIDHAGWNHARMLVITRGARAAAVRVMPCASVHA